MSGPHFIGESFFACVCVCLFYFVLLVLFLQHLAKPNISMLFPDVVFLPAPQLLSSGEMVADLVEVGSREKQGSL